MKRKELSLSIAYGIQQLNDQPIFERMLTAEADAERADFDRGWADHGCTCFKCPPCSYCTHPGNPRNQDEDESCWQLVRTS